MAEAFLVKFGRQTGAVQSAIPKALPRLCRRWRNGIRLFAATSTCGLPATGPGFTAARQSVRPALVRLFSTILRKDPDGYVLVTPVEKVGIKVEDATFLAVEMTVARPQPELVFRFSTNVGDWVEAGPEHPMRFEKAASGGIKPYIHVRGDLWALAPVACL